MRMRALVGTILICSATALAQPRDAPPPAPTGPSGSAQPVDPYANPSTPPPPSTNVPVSPPQGAPAPSQQQPPPQAPQPNTVPPDAKPQPPASEQKPLPSIDKPAPAPVDQPAPPTDKQSTAPSTPQTPAAVIDVENAPAACRDSGSRISSRDRNTALSSKISFAICTASSAIASLSLVDAEASVNDLDHATANAFALLDEVAASGDPRWQIVALHAEGDLLGQMTRRMLDTVPPPGAGATQSAVALHDSRVQLLQSNLQPWVDRAHQAFAQVDQLARENPQLATNQLVGNAVADSRHKLTTGVATR
jgi:hypothetical protein